MENKSLEMLEFPKVREILAGYTSFNLSKEMALSLKPVTDIDLISTWLKRSSEARNLLSSEPDFTIGGVFDIREPVIQASRGKTLELQTLLEIQRTLSAIRALHNRLLHLVDKVPLLSAISGKIGTLPELEKEITRCVSPSAELLDSASDRLAEIRRQLREKRQQILVRLDSIIKSPDNERFIQEPLITERDGRYVIPLKVELRKEIKGIVHDISNTGATAFIEPMNTVDLGNDLRELVIEEQHEIERIIGSLTSWVGREEESISRDLQIVAEIDFALSKAKFAETYRAVEPLIGQDQKVVKLIDARHPLLKGKPVPLNLEIGKDFRGLVITGPNTGGKTVALKTVGLLCLMAQAGLPIPAAHESCVPIFDNIFADIGDEQSIEQTLSTFSWHIGNIVKILNRSTKNSLVLLDELGTATDPSEGAALAQSILIHFLECGVMVVATTHFSELKAFAHGTTGVQNASLDFDPVTFVPTYHLSVGIPGGSNALAVAAQLGLPREIIGAAKERLGKGSLETETLLSDLMAEKQRMEILKQEIQKDKDAAQELRLQMESERQKLKEQEQSILEEIRERLVRDTDALQTLIRDAIYDFKKERSREKLEQAQKALTVVREQMRSEAWQPTLATQEEKEAAGFSLGDRVLLKAMNLQGTVSSAVDGNGQIEIQVGNTRLKLAPENLEKAEQPKVQPGYARINTTIERKPVSLELDLRGKRADEVESELDAYLNSASLANLSQVRIIHGIGTGVVRQMVRQYLSSHPLVNSFRSGKREEGGDGATIVQM